MAVDEQVARAWGRLQTDGPWVPIDVSRHQPHYAVWKLAKPDTGCTKFPAGEHGADCSHITVPDPVTQPWEWVKAFINLPGTVTFMPDFVYLLSNEKALGKGDTPEAALEAAIREWEASHVAK